MFCQRCGTWLRKDYKFCPKCGQGSSSIKGSPSGSCSKPDTSPSVSSFKEFMDKKSKDRQSLKKKPKMEEQVTVSIGIGTSTNGVFKAVRGKSLPLKISKDSSANQILEEAYKKRTSYDRAFRTDRSYKLCYPDGTEVINLPGSEEPFTLEKYKEDLGKTWARITLLLYPEGEEANQEKDPTTASELVPELVEKYGQGLISDEECPKCGWLVEGIHSAGVHLENSGAMKIYSDREEFECLRCFYKYPEPDASNETHQASELMAISSMLDASNETHQTGEPSAISNMLADSNETHHAGEPLNYIFNMLGNLPSRDMKVHRSNVLKDLIEEFKDTEIFKYDLNLIIVDERGNEEAGRGSGVLREIISLFWNHFFTSLSMGATEKVPSVRHDYQRQEWEAIGRILVYGYHKANYFPVELSGVFIGCCLFDENEISEDFLFESFLLYIANNKADVLRKCKAGEFDEGDEDLIDLLSSYKCYRQPTKENILHLTCELAHQELIQKPKYISNCWEPIFESLKVQPEFTSFETLKQFYEIKKPTTKKVIKLLDATPLNDSQRNCLDYLKRYIKSLNDNAFRCFLQFTTGSNLLTVTSIQVTFTNLDGSLRRPIAHTCGPTLEVPTTYQSYNELSEEFASVINNKEAWEFTIV